LLQQTQESEDPPTAEEELRCQQLVEQEWTWDMELMSKTKWGVNYLYDGVAELVREHQVSDSVATDWFCENREKKGPWTLYEWEQHKPKQPDHAPPSPLAQPTTQPTMWNDQVKAELPTSKRARALPKYARDHMPPSGDQERRAKHAFFLCDEFLHNLRWGPGPLKGNHRACVNTGRTHGWYSSFLLTLEKHLCIFHRSIFEYNILSTYIMFGLSPKRHNLTMHTTFFPQI